MSEMVERVAKIFADDRCSGARVPCSLPPDHCSCWELARAAIEAMREPTEGMIEQGSIKDECISQNGMNKDEDPAQLIWHTMIDEALK